MPRRSRFCFSPPASLVAQEEAHPALSLGRHRTAGREPIPPCHSHTCPGCQRALVRVARPRAGPRRAGQLRRFRSAANHGARVRHPERADQPWHRHEHGSDCRSTPPMARSTSRSSRMNGSNPPPCPAAPQPACRHSAARSISIRMSSGQYPQWRRPWPATTPLHCMPGERERTIPTRSQHAPLGFAPTAGATIPARNAKVSLPPPVSAWTAKAI